MNNLNYLSNLSRQTLEEVESQLLDPHWKPYQALRKPPRRKLGKKKTELKNQAA